MYASNAAGGVSGGTAGCLRGRNAGFSMVMVAREKGAAASKSFGVRKTPLYSSG